VLAEGIRGASLLAHWRIGVLACWRFRWLGRWVVWVVSTLAH